MCVVSPQSSSSTSGMGVGIGVAVGIILIAAIAFIMVKRRQTNRISKRPDVMHLVHITPGEYSTFSMKLL